MPTIKTHYRLLIMGMFRAGQWDHYPTEEEIFEVLSKRHKDPFIFNGERLNFQVEKIQFFDPHYLKVGDEVEVIEYFWFYDESYEVGRKFIIQEGHVKHGFEKFVKKVEGVKDGI